MSPLKSEAEQTPHAQCRDACTGPHRWFNTGDGVGGLKYWCEGPRPTNEPIEAWVDKQGDVWRLGDDGLMHSFETAPFPREYIEKKWGPLKPARVVS